MQLGIIHSRYSRGYFEGFLLSLVIVWLPFKLVAYFAPFLFLAWFIVRSNSGRTLLNFTLSLFIYTLIVGFYQLCYFWLGEEFLVQNTLLSVLTYGSILTVIVLPWKIKFESSTYSKCIKAIRIFIIAEALLGIAQVFVSAMLNNFSFDFAAGDVAQGTLNPLSILDAKGNLNNQIYTNNLILLLLFYTPYAMYKRKGVWISVVGFIAIILASVWHLFIALIAAIVIITFAFSSSLTKFSGTRILIGSALIILIFITIIIQPKNYSLINHYFEKISSLESPKAKATVSSVTDLPKEFPWVYITGLGPGQYSSRASLICTGRYFGDFENPKKLPFIEPNSSRAFRNYIFPKWKEVVSNPETYGNSTMARPFYSLLSILIEFGYIVFVLILSLVINLIFRIRAVYQDAALNKNFLRAYYALSCGIAILYLGVISFFENYLEVAHAIFIGLLLIKLFYTALKTNEI